MSLSLRLRFRALVFIQSSHAAVPVVSGGTDYVLTSDLTRRRLTADGYGSSNGVL